MDLFSVGQNLLPYDGEVRYYGALFSETKAMSYFQSLLNEVAWANDEVLISGKRIVTKRKVAWYGDSSFEYTYSNTSKRALPWIAVLLELRELVERESGETYNSCLLNLYHDGSEGMAWHSDAEKNLKKNAAIASVSFGAARKFVFKHKVSKAKAEFVLTNGSLLVMKGETQSHWLHSLPTTKLVKTPRINLTFRSIKTK